MKALKTARLDKSEAQKIRLCLNQIAPNNFEKKVGELRAMLIGDAKLLAEDGFDEQATALLEEEGKLVIDDEKLGIVVHTIFRKAQTEHLFSNFYCKLCSTIVRIELQWKGKKATPSNLRHCDFRRKLLDYCKDCFEDFFSSEAAPEEAKDAKGPAKPEGEEEAKERLLKRKHKLMGNIEFVGELHKEYLLSDSIAKSVFSTLLKPETFSDDTIDAALRFIEKVGPGIEERILKQKNAQKKTFTQDEYDEILQHFTDTMNMDELPDNCTHLPSNRIKILIKNMFTNKKDGWRKTVGKSDL